MQQSAYIYARAIQSVYIYARAMQSANSCVCVHIHMRYIYSGVPIECSSVAASLAHHIQPGASPENDALTERNNLAAYLQLLVGWVQTLLAAAGAHQPMQVRAVSALTSVGSCEWAQHLTKPHSQCSASQSAVPRSHCAPEPLIAKVAALSAAVDETQLGDTGKKHAPLTR